MTREITMKEWVMTEAEATGLTIRSVYKRVKDGFYGKLIRVRKVHKCYGFITEQRCDCCNSRLPYTRR